MLARFNPRPSFLAGETRDDRSSRFVLRVSIHARHFWRAKPVSVIAGIAAIICFNPRPSFLAGET